MGFINMGFSEVGFLNMSSVTLCAPVQSEYKLVLKNFLGETM